MGNDEKKIEVFIDQLMSEDVLEKPSLDFTNNVMFKVEALANSKATVYKPLISKPVWFVILGSFLALVGNIYLKEPVTNSEWINRFDISIVANNLFGNFSVNFSSTLMYAFVFLALMVSIQVPLLKHYFNKRMTF